MAHLDLGRNTECPFCCKTETVAHIFTACQRLQELFGQLRELCGKLGMVFSRSLDQGTVFHTEAILFGDFFYFARPSLPCG